MDRFGGYVGSTAWAEDDLQCETAIRIPESIPREPGYPAVKLSSIVSASIQQTLMDKAKHATWRRPRDGDYALLSRNPVLSHESVRCVRIIGWDKQSIGVHPEYCVPLNVDYDGDEVNVQIVDGRKCEQEARSSIDANVLSKFSDENVERVLREFRGKLTADSLEVCDFMTFSTMSITQAGSKRPNTSLHKLCRCKDELWDIIVDGMDNIPKVYLRNPVFMSRTKVPKRHDKCMKPSAICKYVHDFLAEGDYAAATYISTSYTLAIYSKWDVLLMGSLDSLASLFQHVEIRDIDEGKSQIIAAVPRA
ncbi:unnamed protein product [Peronospora belbahrii]|uniref:RNA polymerase alpha subunit domain-containing protein n=1 Tax=Peronospora belbahrii TaxID=622444 RepID=A0AAU9KTB5_9STRA|nr:unnamed protein product [Peronospora belbahrii]